VKREAQAVVLFVLGGAILRASLTGQYLRYVRAGLRPFLIVAGVVLIMTAICTLWYEIQANRAQKRAPAHDHEHRHQGDDGHGHAHVEPRMAWLLVLPVFALVVAVPPALGSFAANRTGTALQKPPGFATLPAGNPVKISVLDYATRAVYDQTSLGTRPIEISGFITMGDHGVPYLTRMVLNCCAADALPIKVALTGQVPVALRPNAWVDVTGTYTGKQIKDRVNAGTIPFIQVSSTRSIKAPQDQYES
jgi:uncharacterized repeat protein (TIGR03943 family)